jgi:hypothetical protein
METRPEGYPGQPKGYIEPVEMVFQEYAAAIDHPEDFIDPRSGTELNIRR